MAFQAFLKNILSFNSKLTTKLTQSNPQIVMMYAKCNLFANWICFWRCCNILKDLAYYCCSATHSRWFFWHFWHHMILYKNIGKTTTCGTIKKILGQFLQSVKFSTTVKYFVYIWSSWISLRSYQILLVYFFF